VARSLRRAKTSTIGVIIADITNPFFAELVRGIEDRIYGHEEGFNLILWQHRRGSRQGAPLPRRPPGKRIEGLIIVPTGENAASLEELVRAGLPIVFADRFIDGLGVDSVVVDSEDGAFVLTSHVIASGHRRIGVLRAMLAANTLEMRIEGYRRALESAGIAFDPNQIISCRHSIEDAHQAGLRILDSPDRPTAVFCTNNYMTLGMVQAITDRGLRCPQDIAVVGFDDFAWAASFSPRLTALAQPAYELARSRRHPDEAHRPFRLRHAGASHPQGHSDRPRIRRALGKDVTCAKGRNSGLRCLHCLLGKDVHAFENDVDLPCNVGRSLG